MEKKSNATIQRLMFFFLYRAIRDGIGENGLHQIAVLKGSKKKISPFKGAFNQRDELIRLSDSENHLIAYVFR